MQLIDEQLEAGLRGDFETGFRIGKQLEKETPDDPRARFNMGWYKMMYGELLEGHKLLDYGRGINIYGNRHIGSPQPIWHGATDSTVLLNLEGGLGDQIHGLRYAYALQELGNRVVISCSLELAKLFAKDFITVSHGSERGIYHDYWLPAMSAVVAFGYEYYDISGQPYIHKTARSEGKVGVAWFGNPKFEHHQHRLFPKELMFDTVRDMDCISLQKEGEIPQWMERPSLTTWEDTQKAISRCDLVISSCTSVAHLAAAMGIETWIVIPILPYYLWSLDCDKTPYYDSVTLFRQKKYGEWEQPFNKIKKRLGERGRIAA